MGSEYGAQQRGGPVSPRVHLPTRAGASAAASAALRGVGGSLPSPLPPPRGSPPSTAAVVSIHRPRPEPHRHLNEYVETPLRPECATRTSATTAPGVPPRGESADNRHHRAGHKRPVVTDQPKGGGGGGAPASSSPSASAGGDCSIVCRECGRCRCDACRRPRPMPSLWLCRDFCLCSAESCVDYGSCLCCVKGLMYHCAAGDGDDDTCADDPCACGPPRAAARWACLAGAALLLPCLCCYWPLRALSACAQACYSGCCDSRGCRCRPARHPPSLGEKRLLDVSGPEL